MGLLHLHRENGEQPGLELSSSLPFSTPHTLFFPSILFSSPPYSLAYRVRHLHRLRTSLFLQRRCQTCACVIGPPLECGNRWLAMCAQLPHMMLHGTVQPVHCTGKSVLLNPVRSYMWMHCLGLLNAILSLIMLPLLYGTSF